MNYNNITIRDRSDVVVLKNGRGNLSNGLLTVQGSLEPGQSLTIDAKYKLTGDPGLSTEGRYAGSPGPGKYNFKID